MNNTTEVDDENIQKSKTLSNAFVEVDMPDLPDLPDLPDFKYLITKKGNNML